MTAKHHAPTCFGLPSLYHQESEFCRACDVRNRCDETSYSKLIALSDKIDVKDAIARYQDRSVAGIRVPLQRRDAPEITISLPDRSTPKERFRLTLHEADMRLVAVLPVKVAAKVHLMMQKNEDRAARQALAKGVNPFPLKGAAYLSVACGMLLEKGFTRSELRLEYIKRFGWTVPTAASHVSIVAAMFPALRFAIEDARRFTLHPNLKKKQ